MSDYEFTPPRPSEIPAGAPRFSAGELVLHRRYGYRGVVAGSDRECRASDLWYLSNQTQPRREQPWYHVLVSGAQHTTYVAEDNLTADEGGEQVVNPLTKTLFAHFSGGRYTLREGMRFPPVVGGGDE